MSRQSDLIAKILTGQKISGPASKNSLLINLSTPIAAPIVPQQSASAAQYGIGQDPSTGKPFAPPVMSGVKHPGGKLGLAAQAAIAAQYDPAINAIASQIGTTQNEAAKARHQIKRQGQRAVGDLSVLYGDLAHDVKRTTRREDRGYRRDIRSTRQSYRDLGREVNTNYSTSMGSTAKELERLGLDPSVALAGAARDQAFLNSQQAADRRRAVGNQRESRRGFNAMMDQVRADTVATGLSQIGQSKTATRTALANLANTLADNLFKLRSQQATLQGQRLAAVLKAQASKSTVDPLDRKIKKAQLAKLLSTIPGMPGYAPSTGNDPYASTGIGKGLAWIAEQGGAIQHPVRIDNMLQYLTAGAGPGRTIPWDKHNYGQIWNAVVKTGKRHGWTQNDINAMQRAIQISLGLG